ncbi:hypothetical protein LIER_00381 [Lithospermum erythrorhizon]|uniref:Ribosomal protein L34e superfamily protein n=1 Tax=Lithospermum erythrorhizon TaxID=34254 RepID=A0AAV3NIA2_LITER
MVCYHSPIVVDQHLGMGKPVNLADPYVKLKQIHQFHRKKSTLNLQDQLNIPGCEQSPYAIIDVIIMIAVICACGVLVYPNVKTLLIKSVELFYDYGYLVEEEISRNPMIYGCLGLSILFAALALLAILIYANNWCGRPSCLGLRDAAEFDIQIETEECVKHSECVTNKGVKRGVFELPRDHHRELEAELKKMAPPNGRAVLIFRARCGCSIGRLEVPGPKKSRRIKK